MRNVYDLDMLNWDNNESVCDFPRLLASAASVHRLQSTLLTLQVRAGHSGQGTEWGLDVDC
jgi:hypothetical protein